MTFEEWMRDFGLSESTVKKYGEAIEGALSEWAIDAGITAVPLSSLTDLAGFREVSSQLVQLPVFVQRNKSGHGMYGAAIRRYIAYLDATPHLMARPVSARSEDRTAASVRARGIEESGYPEGVESYRLHRHLERSGVLPALAKAKRLAETGRLDCEVCGFSFGSVYGELGSSYIEAHHTVPVSSMSEVKVTKVEEIALVCANCHRMLHRGEHLLTVDELQKIVRSCCASEPASPSSPPCA